MKVQVKLTGVSIHDALSQIVNKYEVLSIPCGYAKYK